jgi:hypothetical protein
MYEISYADGTSTLASTLKVAIAAIKADYPSAVIGHDGDLSDGGDRTLCWANADDAANDDGGNAVASIIRSDD